MHARAASTGNRETDAYTRAPFRVCRIIYAAAGKKKKKQKKPYTQTSDTSVIQFVCRARTSTRRMLLLSVFFSISSIVFSRLEQQRISRDHPRERKRYRIDRAGSIVVSLIQHSASLSAGIGAQMRFLGSSATMRVFV